MTNNEIIYNAAISANIYTQDEAAALIAETGDLPIHTFAERKKAGYVVKRGEHAALAVNLWKYTSKPSKASREAAEAEGVEAADDPHYYMAKAYLFTAAQVKPLRPATEPSDEAEAPAPQDPTAEATTPETPTEPRGEAKAPATSEATTQDESPSQEAQPSHEASTVPATPGAWKKHSFYTMHRGTDRKPGPVLVNGYTDGVYNYYSIGDKCKTWFAVHPIYGLAVSTAATRQAAQTQAQEHAEDIRKVEQAPGEKLKGYAAQIAAAKSAQ